MALVTTVEAFASRMEELVRATDRRIATLERRLREMEIETDRRFERFAAEAFAPGSGNNVLPYGFILCQVTDELQGDGVVAAAPIRSDPKDSRRDVDKPNEIAGILAPGASLDDLVLAFMVGVHTDDDPPVIVRKWIGVPVGNTGSPIQLAVVEETLGTTIKAHLLADPDEKTLSFKTLIRNGSSLSQAFPTTRQGDKVFVATIDGIRYALDVYQTYTECP